MEKLYTTSDAAERLGISQRRVQKLCEEHGIGRLLSARQRVLTAADLRRLRTCRRPGPGRPAAK